MIKQILDDLKYDVSDDTPLSTSSVYALNVLEKLKFNRQDIHDLWMMVSDELTFILLEGSFEDYKKLSQFNSYLFFYLMVELRNKE